MTNLYQLTDGFFWSYVAALSCISVIKRGSMRLLRAFEEHGSYLPCADARDRLNMVTIHLGSDGISRFLAKVQRLMSTAWNGRITRRLMNIDRQVNSMNIQHDMSRPASTCIRGEAGRCTSLPTSSHLNLTIRTGFRGAYRRRACLRSRN